MQKIMKLRVILNHYLIKEIPLYKFLTLSVRKKVIKINIVGYLYSGHTNFEITITEGYLTMISICNDSLKQHLSQV